MDQFIVSARKYRPISFADVVGQKHITDTLEFEINNNKLAQAFLFTGPRGVGKTTCARILAKVINSVGGNVDPSQDFAYNVFELDAASNNSVDDIRHLNEQVRVPPQTGKYKVYIIDEVHMLSAAAFNAFLKTLEEPPAYAIFILATTEKHKIIPTILSRCQVFNFNRIKVSDMVSHLQSIAQKEGVEADVDALHLVAKKADGGLRDALSIFDQLVSFSGNKISYDSAVEILSILDSEFYFKLTDSFQDADSASALLLYDEILMKGFEGSMFLSGLSEHFRNLLVCLHANTESLLDVAESFQGKFKEQASKVTLGWLVNALNITNQFDIDFKSSRNQRLHVELCLIKLSYLKSLVSGYSEEVKKKSLAFKTSTPKITIDKEAVKPVSEITSTEIPKKAIVSKGISSIASTRIVLNKPIAPPIQMEPEMVEELAPEFKKENPELISTPISASIEAPILKTFSLETFWNQFAEEAYKTGKKSSSSAMKVVAPILKDNVVFIEVKNEQQKEAIENIRIDFLSLARKSGAPSGISFDFFVNPDKTENLRPYTDKEKIDYLSSKNVLLEKLIKELNLKV